MCRCASVCWIRAAAVTGRVECSKKVDLFEIDLPDTIQTQLTLGISESIPGAVTFNLGPTSANWLIAGHFSSAGVGTAERGWVETYLAGVSYAQ